LPDLPRNQAASTDPDELILVPQRTREIDVKTAEGEGEGRGTEMGQKQEAQSRALTSLVYGIAISEIAPAISDFAPEKVTCKPPFPRNLRNFSLPPHVRFSFHFVRNNDPRR